MNGVSGEFLEALQAIAKEKEISADALLETVEAALVTAYKKNFAAQGEIKVRINSSKATFQVFCLKTVSENPELEAGEISVEEARAYDPDIMPGEVLEIEVTPGTVGRIDAQTAKQVLVQRIREAEREKVYEEYNERVGEVVTGTVQRREFKNIFINLGKIEAVLPPQEQVETEPYRFNDRLKLYMLEVRRTPKGPQVIVSRTHPSLIRRLFELEVPEISSGVVEIKAMAREPGHRTKVAVWSNDAHVDPVGACVGARGSRVRMVTNELRGERIDVVPFSDDTAELIQAALQPARVREVRLDDVTGTATVVVSDYQLSLAIGKEGQNARLAARLSGWRVDIKSEAQLAEEEAGLGEEWAEGEWVENEAGEMVWQPAEGGEAVSAAEWSRVASGSPEPEGDAVKTAEVAEAGAGATAEAGAGSTTEAGVGSATEAGPPDAGAAPPTAAEGSA